LPPLLAFLSFFELFLEEIWEDFEDSPAAPVAQENAQPD